MRATYFEPQIELVRFDCADIVASSALFGSFFLKPINAPTSDTPNVSVESGELDTF